VSIWFFFALSICSVHPKSGHCHRSIWLHESNTHGPHTSVTLRALEALPDRGIVVVVLTHLPREANRAARRSQKRRQTGVREVAAAACGLAMARPSPDQVVGRLPLSVFPENSYVQFATLTSSSLGAPRSFRGTARRYRARHVVQGHDTSVQKDGTSVQGTGTSVQGPRHVGAGHRHVGTEVRHVGTGARHVGTEYVGTGGTARRYSGTARRYRGTARRYRGHGTSVQKDGTRKEIEKIKICKTIQKVSTNKCFPRKKRMSARAALSPRSSPSLLVALFLPLLSFPAFAQLGNKRLSLSPRKGKLKPSLS